ncbi:MAG: hypothetical protein AB1349_08845 [Elusimicrobiota bacterium]
MKFSFLIFLVGITLLSLYGKNFDIKAIKSSNETTKTVQKPVNKQHLDKETLKSFQDELGLAADKPMVEVKVVSPILDKFSKVTPKDIGASKTLTETINEFYLKTVNSIKSLLSKYDTKITYSALLIAFIAFVSKWLDIYKLAYLVSKVGWFFSRFVLFIFSISAIILWFSLKKNLWLDVGDNLFFIPLQVLIISSFALKIMDMNYPIWNRLFGSFVLPIISGIATNAIMFL